MNIVEEPLFIIVITLFASSGFWRFIEFKLQKTSNIDKDRKLHNKLLLGLAHDRIIFLGVQALEKGFISHDEYENLCKYLYAPYIDMGGNGTAVKLMDEVNKLPTTISSYKRRR